MAGPIHYEFYLRKTPISPWALALATEDRALAVQSAEETLNSKLAVSVRVTKETLDPDTMEFNSITILTRGAAEPQRKRAAEPVRDQVACNTPGDLYTPHARATLGRLLEDWLSRNGVTAYELLHRPDLAEKLDASGTELQHVIQKVAIPESQTTGRPSHDLVRHYQKLAEDAISRLITAGRRGSFADITLTPLAQIAEDLAGKPDRTFLMGGVLSRAAAAGSGAGGRLSILLDLADNAPASGPTRGLVFSQIEQILCDMMGTHSALTEILGPGLDLGCSLSAVVRISAPSEIEKLLRVDPRMAAMMPSIDGPAVRLGHFLASDQFPTLARTLTRMVLRELTGPRRLRPGDALGEIASLRVLAAALTATAGRLLTLEEVQEAFVERSRHMITADFVTACLAGRETVLQEIETLIRLCENVTGAANKRAAARWLDASLTAMRFETEMRATGVHPVQKLAVLAGLQRSILGCAFAEPEQIQLLASVGALGGLIEADARLILQMGRADAPAPHRIAALLRLAAGQTGPTGPVADRAKAEVLRLVRATETRTALAEAPEILPEIRDLMKVVGLAA